MKTLLKLFMVAVAAFTIQTVQAQQPYAAQTYYLLSNPLIQTNQSWTYYSATNAPYIASTNFATSNTVATIGNTILPMGVANMQNSIFSTNVQAPLFRGRGCALWCVNTVTNASPGGTAPVLTFSTSPDGTNWAMPIISWTPAWTPTSGACTNLMYSTNIAPTLLDNANWIRLTSVTAGVTNGQFLSVFVTEFP